jgi:hypothetical protein
MATNLIENTHYSELFFLSLNYFFCSNFLISTKIANYQRLTSFSCPI